MNSAIAQYADTHYGSIHSGGEAQNHFERDAVHGLRNILARPSNFAPPEPSPYDGPFFPGEAAEAEHLAYMATLEDIQLVRDPQVAKPAPKRRRRSRRLQS